MSSQLLSKSKDDFYFVAFTIICRDECWMLCKWNLKWVQDPSSRCVQCRTRDSQGSYLTRILDNMDHTPRNHKSNKRLAEICGNHAYMYCTAIRNAGADHTLYLPNIHRSWSCMTAKIFSDECGTLMLYKNVVDTQCAWGVARLSNKGRTELQRTAASWTTFSEAWWPTTSGRMCMHAAYRKVPPENRTHKAVEEAEDKAGMIPIKP